MEALEYMFSDYSVLKAVETDLVYYGLTIVNLYLFIAIGDKAVNGDGFLILAPLIQQLIVFVDERVGDIPKDLRGYRALMKLLVMMKIVEYGARRRDLDAYAPNLIVAALGLVWLKCTTSILLNAETDENVEVQHKLRVYQCVAVFLMFNSLILTSEWIPPAFKLYVSIALTILSLAFQGTFYEKRRIIRPAAAIISSMIYVYMNGGRQYVDDFWSRSDVVVWLGIASFITIVVYQLSQILM